MGRFAGEGSAGRVRPGTGRRIRRASLVVAGLLGLAVPVAAGPYEDALAAFERGDHAAALQRWRPLAEQGDAGAQNNLGLLYEKGQGVAQDHAEAAKWYRAAADQGNAFAQANLGLMHQNGWGVAQDHAEAVKWYRLAAEQGNAGAENNLAVMYKNGWGVPQDYGDALKWFRRAAYRGNALAQANLGIMYLNGWGVARNSVQAHKWLNLAAVHFADKGDRDQAGEARDRLASRMTAAEINDAQRMASAWKNGRR